MIRAQVQSSLDHLTGLENLLLDRQLVLNGAFKDEIKRLEAVRDEAGEKLGMVQTVADADKYRADAEAYAAKLRSAAEKDSATAAKALADANGKMNSAIEKERSVASREIQALDIMAAYQAKEDAFNGICANREAALATREASISSREKKLASDAEIFAAQKAEGLKKLEAAKAMLA